MTIPVKYMAALVLLLSGACLCRPAAAQDTPAAAAAATPALHVLRPVANAVVRETVPVRIAASDLPSDGYVGITIDDVFRTARVLPDAKDGLVYDWDTKSAYTTPDDPDTPKFTSDGDHTIKLDLYDHSGTLLGESVIPVKVANKIIVPAQGIKLSYQWSPNQQLHYLHQTELNVITPNAAGSPGSGMQNVQASLVRFSRSVEDTSGGGYLVRDSVLPKSYIIDHGQTQAVQAVYNVKSLYRTVDARGDVLRDMAALSSGQHIGYSIPVMPARRVAVGDSWQSPVEMTLSWAPLAPAKVNAESRLEGFEWQNGYPTAKIRETYTGPATFGSPTPSVQTGAGAAAFGGATAAPQAVNPLSGTFQNVKYERVVYFAYNSGRLVRTETTLTVQDDLTPDRISALGIGASASTGGYQSGSQSPYGGLLEGDPEQNQQPQMPPPGAPGGYPGGGYQGGPGGYPQQGGYNGGGGGYQGGGGGYVATPPAPSHLKATDVTTLLT